MIRYNLVKLKPSNPETPSPTGSQLSILPKTPPISATTERRTSTISNHREANEAINVIRQIYIITKDAYMLSILKSALGTKRAKLDGLSRLSKDGVGFVHVLPNPAYANALKVSSLSRMSGVDSGSRWGSASSAPKSFPKKKHMIHRGWKSYVTGISHWSAEF
jgi:hypothetical protein